ncbi:hypothetical protein C1Y08_24355 [Pseudomonas sp. FW306-02-F02-AA]|uniref:Uncharacterized protein n=1 Tax=Pseudomonas fluorescens TaxID=294 RepID=A0A0N7GZY8_PSEFL|nr:hypothetical protein AO353_11450 [Pseudomonas fluorescens]PMZ01710.1 hypothetical protein C1Y07_23795 [Pseudomonas sp. FW306-02-F02-AB]PMZ07605.1 hypothetical protein C1Y06_23750 [Pseudomonas sp. FW306-02-H06C]PMZ13323.1 hypothetical protein C1Y08_24355 [Pseudomonas sp. FW306-02-F02-AA]PMZ19367.1 hypothetical protein C1Y09_24420 [Pseudomonas sp. FW306-02-F08-AA]PMZ29335.1 hypothetical protein C1Y05_01930 [Pseudomonas sp. FW306-02-F04-BA]PMZ31900.1 hypothetical protein C1X99_24125 [Pseudomo
MIKCMSRCTWGSKMAKTTKGTYTRRKLCIYSSVMHITKAFTTNVYGSELLLKEKSKQVDCRVSNTVGKSINLNAG